MQNDIADLEKFLGIDFSDQKILTQALTHRSYLNEIKEEISSNERLEFLGDAVLELIISDYLFKTYPYYPEGKLTNLRSAIVNTKCLATVAAKLKLGEFLYLSKGEESGGGRNNESLLADVFESVLGAIFIDQGIKQVEKFLKKNLFPVILEIEKNGTYHDYKSMLQEKAQEKYKITPTYSVLKEEGPDHAKIFYSAVSVENKKIGEGKGKSKQEAEQDAARAGLASIRPA